MPSRDIKKGDEFSYDYGFSFDKDYKNYPCRCGSKNCCGYIVREGSRWRIKKIQKKMKRALFISTRNPFSERYSGDVIGSQRSNKKFEKNLFTRHCEPW